jgi:hypothetical protein
MDLYDVFKEALENMIYDDQPGIRFPDMGHRDNAQDEDKWDEVLEKRTELFIDELTREMVSKVEELAIKHKGELI